MEFPVTGEALVPLSKIAQQYKSTNGTVLAVLVQKGIHPAVVVPFSRGLMRQFRVSDLPPDIGAAVKQRRDAARHANISPAARAKGSAPAARAKATATRAANQAERDRKELVKLRKLAKLLKELGE